MAPFRIGIIGSGNVGSHLCRAFSSAGQKVVMFTRRGATHLLSDVKGLVWTEKAEIFRRDFDFVILAVNDDSIEEVASLINPEEGIVLHTSGSKDLATLGKFSDIGVFYPLQSFKKDEVLNYLEIPVFIEANSEKNLGRLRELSMLFSNKVVVMDSEYRKRLHLAAVIANNFTNHLYSLSSSYLKGKGIDFSYLLPLIMETSKRLEGRDPYLLQTGPALRGESKVIKEHLEMLSEHPELKRIYEILSSSIAGKGIH